MRCSFAVVTGLVAMVSAQSSGAPGAPAASGITTTTASTPVVTLDPASEAKRVCRDACPKTDVNCIADCQGVPHPSQDQVRQYIDCQKNCVGSNDQVVKCTNGCISTYYNPVGASNGGNGGNGGSDGSAGASGSNGNKASTTKGDSATKTKSGTTTTSSGAAVAGVSFGSSSAFVGAMAVLFAI